MSKFLQPFTLVDAESTASNVTSNAVDASYLDRLAFFASWTGTSAGTFTVEASVDYDKRLDTGTWITIAPMPEVVAGGATGSAIVEVTDCAAPYYRAVYTASSGTGTLTVVVSGKGF